MQLNSTMFGEIAIEKVKKNGQVKKYKFNNLITNTGLSIIPGRRFEQIISACFLGTGTTLPTITDSDLTNRTRGTTNNGGVSQTTDQNYTTGVTSRTWSFYFDFGQLNGNYTEIGFGLGTGSSPNVQVAANGLFSKALIKDENGNPSVLTVMSDEALRIYYTLFMQPDFTDKSGSFTLTGNLSRTINYVAKTIGWGGNSESGFTSSGLRTRTIGNSVNGITTKEARDYLLNVTPFETIDLTGLPLSFTWINTDRVHNGGSVHIQRMTSRANEIGPGISEHSFLMGVDMWNVPSEEIHGLLLNFHGTEDQRQQPTAAILYVVLFDSPLGKDEQKRLGFTISHGWGRV